MEISAKELRQMAGAVDEKHRAVMKTFREETAELHLDTVHTSRRGFLRRAGTTAGVGGAALAFGPALVPVTGLLASANASPRALTDVDIAQYAQSVELAAVAVYGMAGGVLSAGVKPVGELFAKHHQDHADAFGSLAGDKAVKAPNAKLVAAVTPLLQAIKTETDALNLAFVIENQAAATYAFALTVLTVPAAIAGTATILPIEAEHAAILGAALKMDFAGLFPNGAFEAASVGAAGDPKTGLDPAKYPVA